MAATGKVVRHANVMTLDYSEITDVSTSNTFEGNMISHRLLNILQKRQQHHSDALSLRRKREAAGTDQPTSPAASKLGK